MRKPVNILPRTDESILSTPAVRLSEDLTITEGVFLVDAEDENGRVVRHQIPTYIEPTPLGAIMAVVDDHDERCYPLLSVTCVGLATTTLVMHAAEYSWLPAPVAA